MANIKLELGHPVIDGMPLSFKAPCNCNEVTGLKVVWPDGEDAHFIDFTFADAHGNDLTGLGNLFSAGAMVRVILDPPSAKAFIQNADTNAYLEGKFAGKIPMPATSKQGDFLRVKSVDTNGNITEVETAPAASNNVLIAGKWHIAYPENIKESIVAAMIQQVEFETTFALYDDGLVMPNDTNQVVSTHAAKCNAIEIQYQELLGKTYVLVLYHVERSDDALMDVIKTDDGQYIMLAYMQGKWNCPAAAFVDFGVSQNVCAVFKEAFSAIAVQSDVTEAGGTLLSISVTEAADGSVTMVNTLDSGTETIVIGVDENGNPNNLTYNGTEIPIEWVVS